MTRQSPTGRDTGSRRSPIRDKSVSVYSSYCVMLRVIDVGDSVATILIAEDERDLSNLVRRHLEEEGHRVLQAFDGPSAVTAATRERPDLVILDWMLPRLDGLEVCRRIRRESIVPILMLTARSEEIDRVLGLEVGADDYLTKPFSVRELLARVRALLRRVELDRGAISGE